MPENQLNQDALAQAWGEIAADRSFPARVRAAAAIKKMEALTGEDLSALLSLIPGGPKKGTVPNPLTLAEKIVRVVHCKATEKRPGATRADLQRCIRGVTAGNFDVLVKPLIETGKIVAVPYKPATGPETTLFILP